MANEAMSKDTALTLLKEIKNYLTTSGNPVWDKQDIEDAMDAAIEALRARGAVEQLMQEFIDSATEFYAKGYNVAKREIALSGEYERAYQRGKADAQQWTPCSERLPEEESKSYWICTDDGYQCQCRWTNVNRFWTNLTTDWHWHTMEVPQYSKVVAWMPLPEPYKAESEELE